MDAENKLVVTNGGGRGSAVLGEWVLQSTGCKIGSRMYFTTWGL